MPDGYDIVVAGGGVAGLTAGLTAARLGRSTLVLAGGIPGGLLLGIERIDGFPGFPQGVAGYELCPSLQEQADEAGAEVAALELERLDPANGGWRIATAEGEVEARAVIAATGARFRQLGVSGEDRLAGRGISTCASCDGPLLGGATAAVVGGGDSALQEALTLAATAERVIVVHRGDELDGQATYRRRVEEQPVIEVRHGATLEEILGSERVEAVRVRDVASGAVEELAVAAVFPFVGLQPNSGPFADHVALDDRGALRTDDSLATSAHGVFAAGVVRGGAAGRAAAATGEGAAAAIAADAYLG
ncbi:MAG: NAD(P)/FAD-dependent oxidoreductase [Verrucomicrobiota bacterium]